MITLWGMAEHRFRNVYFGENCTPLQRNGMAVIPKILVSLFRRSMPVIPINIEIFPNSKYRKLVFGLE